MKVKVHVFRLEHFPRSKIEFESIFLIKYYIITILNFFVERFGLYLTKSKNGLPNVFSNLARKGSRVFFFKLGSKFFCQRACINLLNSRGGPQSLDFVITTYSYPLLKVDNLHSAPSHWKSNVHNYVFTGMLKVLRTWLLLGRIWSAWKTNYTNHILVFE